MIHLVYAHTLRLLLYFPHYDAFARLLLATLIWHTQIINLQVDNDQSRIIIVGPLFRGLGQGVVDLLTHVGIGF